MPSGSMPTYSYRPAVGGKAPHMRTKSNKRARLWAGGTYFRTREPGLMGNQISIALIDTKEDEEEELPGGGNPDPPGEEEEVFGWLVVTNHNTNTDENVEGPVDVVFLEQNLKWNEQIVIDNLTTTPRARKYSISLQIAPSFVELGPVNISGLIHIPPYISARVIPRTSEITPTSTITFKPRTKIYELEPIEKQVTVDSGSESGGTTTESQIGWDPEALRALVNEQDPWIEMLERSGSGEPGSGNSGAEGENTGSQNPPGMEDEDKPDVQDEGVDDVFLTEFEDTYMEDGDGLPPVPNIERTGPIRSIIHINKGEKPNGEMGNVNVVYEWVGTSSNAGEWKLY